MNYTNNAENQRKLLEKHLKSINFYVSEKLGIKTNLEITESRNYRNEIILGLTDNQNRSFQCGIMEAVFNKVYIETSNVWWNENGVTFELCFKYELIDGGSNSAKFYTIQIENDCIKVFL